MTAATYHRVGSVMDQLRDEFPTLTISKLRFLDAEEIVSPSHRSPAGYRLYTDRDVMRLRYALGLQTRGELTNKGIRAAIAARDAEWYA